MYFINKLTSYIMKFKILLGYIKEDVNDTIKDKDFKNEYFGQEIIEVFSNNEEHFYKSEESFDLLDIEYETLSINKKELLFFILDKYDGIKQEVNLEDNILLLWYDYNNSYEDWFYIKSSKEILENYLSNKIGILDLMKNSSIEIIKRNYENYNSMSTNDNELFISNENNIEFPDNVNIGHNVLSQIQRQFYIHNNTYKDSKNILYKYEQVKLTTVTSDTENIDNNIMLAA